MPKIDGDETSKTPRSANWRKKFLTSSNPPVGGCGWYCKVAPGVATSFDTSSLLDIVHEVSAGTVLHAFELAAIIVHELYLISKL